MRARSHVHTLESERYLAAQMSKLLDQLRDDAVGLIESDLPVENEIRHVLGALVSHVQDLEASLSGSGTTSTTPEPAPEETAPQPTPEETAAQQLANQQLVDGLERQLAQAKANLAAGGATSGS